VERAETLQMRIKKAEDAVSAMEEQVGELQKENAVRLREDQSRSVSLCFVIPYTI
jgi:hypothetical protein